MKFFDLSFGKNIKDEKNRKSHEKNVTCSQRNPLYFLHTDNGTWNRLYWNRDISTTLSGSGSFLLFPCKVKFQENGSKSDPEPEPGSESTEAFLLGRSKQGFSLKKTELTLIS